jgi:cytochrome c biogenesis protein CcdA/thiol-disulfide isomerase/thioredoxin
MVFIFAVLLLSQHIDGPAVHFFYRPSCGHCMDILLSDIPKLQAKYTFALKKYDIDLLDNYRLLENMEQVYGKTNEDLPVVFVGDSVFYGPEEIYEKMDGVLRNLTKRQQKELERPVRKKDTLPQIVERIRLDYFFQPGCEECRRLDAMFSNLEKRDSIVVLRRSIFDDTSKVLLEALSEKIGMPEERRLIVPVIIYGRGYLIKEEITTGNIFGLIKEHRADNNIIDSIDIEGAENSLLRRFGQFSLLGIVFAGLLDGVNPCAFATIIFFVGYLLFLGRRRRDVIFMAVSFITAVFIAYFLIGIGAYNLLDYVVGYEVVAKIIFLCFGIVAVSLGVVSLRDFVYARKGHYDKMILQLPLGIKQRIHRDIKERTAMGGIILGSFAAGLIVSFLEFGCTGQIYLPTITFMISKAGLRLKPVLTLLIYNIMFVVPLVLISLLAVIVSTDKIAKSLNKRIPMIKFLTAILFFALGIALILSA